MFFLFVKIALTSGKKIQSSSGGEVGLLLNTPLSCHESDTPVHLQSRRKLDSITQPMWASCWGSCDLSHLYPLKVAEGLLPKGPRSDEAQCSDTANGNLKEGWPFLPFIMLSLLISEVTDGDSRQFSNGVSYVMSG